MTAVRLRPVLRCVVVALVAAAHRRVGAGRPCRARRAGAAGRSRALPRWQWTVDSNAFIGFNYQHRKFRDFNAWESQNWVMAHGPARRCARNGRRVVDAVARSADAARHRIAAGVPDRRDVPARAARSTTSIRTISSWVSARRIPAPRRSYDDPGEPLDLVGSPSIGPMAFMHRPSAMRKPAGAAVAPLHGLDAHHARRRARRRRRGRLAGRGIVVQGTGAGRKPPRHRPWRARFDRRAAVVEPRSLVSSDLRRDAHAAGAARAI